MADPHKSVEENVEGDFFVDETCINCDTCRQLAPGTFRDQGDHSYVYAQPEGPGQRREACRALLCCPTGSIGNRRPSESKAALLDLPLAIAEGVYYSGFNSPKSYGGNSFFIRHDGGNWLVDSPRFVPHLIRRFRELGGIAYIFLTHRDDVADAGRYAHEFGARRIIHRGDVDAEPAAEIVVEGEEPLTMGPEFQIVPVPGHTRGHMVLIYRSEFLFSGDHLAYDPDRRALYAFRQHCWYSWEEQTRSMERLLNYRFEWVLAGHGNRGNPGAGEMSRMLRDLIKSMKEPDR